MSDMKMEGNERLRKKRKAMLTRHSASSSDVNTVFDNVHHQPPAVVFHVNYLPRTSRLHNALPHKLTSHMAKR